MFNTILSILLSLLVAFIAWKIVCWLFKKLVGFCVGFFKFSAWTLTRLSPIAIVWVAFAMGIVPGIIASALALVWYIFALPRILAWWNS